jgi:hypothetical protein
MREDNAMRVTGRATLCLLFATALLAPPTLWAQSFEDFDHFRTRFPLVGKHERLNCESCHLGGEFEGTPTRCAVCHDGTARRSESGKDINHIQSTDECADCHLFRGWLPVRMDHGAVTGSCVSCHDGMTASGKHIQHIDSSDFCQSCHHTGTWRGARFDHSEVSGSCVSCHDGGTARGKSMEHVPSSNDCERCHSTRSWEGAFFDHATVTAPCSSCHAADEPGDHFVTTEECDACHSTVRWRGPRFTHSSPNYPGDHAGSPPCQSCHPGNNPEVSYLVLENAPDCAGCHESDFEDDEHKRVDSPARYYTASQLKDCTGACHIFKADGSLADVKPGPRHRARDGDWD